MPSSNRQAQSLAKIILIVITVLLVVGVIVGGISLYRLMFSGSLLHGTGTGDIAVPDVTGMAEEQALTVLRGAGLQPKVMERVFSDAQDKGLVFKQNPTAPQQVRRRRTVLLWVSLGRASCIVPDLLGEHINQVQPRLVSAGLQLGSVTKVYYEDVPSGRVLSQSPAAGEEFTSSVPVDVIIADTSDLPRVPMPDVCEMPLSSAEDLLAAKNLHLSKVTYVANDTATSGYVTKQSQAANGEVALGARIELEVALPSAELAAPTRTVTLRIPVPAGPDKQRVRIKVYDNLSAKGQVAYDEERAPGDIVEQKLDLEGKATVQVFINNMGKVYREDRL
jgi:eukaryotic-like serine/threonine-protein kinase